MELDSSSPFPRLSNFLYKSKKTAHRAAELIMVVSLTLCLTRLLFLQFALAQANMKLPLCKSQPDSFHSFTGGVSLCRGIWEKRAKEGDPYQRCILGNWGLRNQNHSPEPSLDFWGQVSGVISLPDRTVWSSPRETALGDSATKLDNTGLFYLYCLRAQGGKFNSRMGVQHRRVVPVARAAGAE